MYENLSKELTARMEREKREGTFVKLACANGEATRRNADTHDAGTVWRPPFVRDIDKIMNCPYYNRYADKTQVFSFYKNDDITRRGLHVQLVSRIARTIGGALNLNLDLIEAIALGHDIGHTPFGHAGERFLDGLLFADTGRHFAHNLHSVRVLDGIYPYNISLQTLIGIAAHDGELELARYCPKPLNSFEEFDALMEDCYTGKVSIKSLLPSTLEGCVVRISDIIAYLGKDRQDAERAHLVKESQFDASLGGFNAQIINNLVVNVIENSYGKDCICLDDEHFAALKRAKSDNYELVYTTGEAKRQLDETVKPMTEMMYERFTKDLKRGDESSPVFTHHLAYVNRAHLRRARPYGEGERAEIIAADYIASMTDDYFIDLFARLFPDSKLKIVYKGYFD